MRQSAETDRGLAELTGFRAAFEASGDVLYDWDLATDGLVLTGAPAGLFGTRAGDQPGSGESFQIMKIRNFPYVNHIN